MIQQTRLNTTAHRRGTAQIETTHKYHIRLEEQITKYTIMSLLTKHNLKLEKPIELAKLIKDYTKSQNKLRIKQKLVKQE